MRDKAALLAGLLLLGAVLFNLATLWPEVALEPPVLNDDTLHLTLVGRTVEALERGEDPSDFWVPDFVQGYPLFHHYQHLPHLMTAFLYRGLGGVFPLRTLYDGIRYLLLCTFPLSVYWAGRRLGFRAPTAALAGLLSSLLSSGGLYGMDFSSYVWRGWGMYTQLWGMWLLPPALAGLYLTIREGRAWAGTAVLVAATLLSHTVLGYVLLLSGVLFLFLGPFLSLGRRVLRMGLIVLLVAFLSAYFLLPFFLDRLYMNRSIWEDPGKYDAYGWQWTLQSLFSGRLLDADRFPSLTFLAGLGLVVAIFRWRCSDVYRLLVLFSLFWLALYFGRPTWGVLLNLLPMSSDLHLHRFIVPVHLGALGLAGVGLAWLWEQARSYSRTLASFGEGEAGGRLQLGPLVLAGVLTAGLLAPAYYERIGYLALNGRWLDENLAAYRAEQGVLEGLLEKLRSLPPGRVYAGRAANWGDDYRVGSVPLYAFLSQNGLPNPGYLYHALSLNADIEGYLDESRPATFNLFNLRYIVAPEDHPAPSFARPIAAYGRHVLYGVETSGYFDLVDSDLLLYGPRSDWFPAAQAWVWSDWVEARQHPRIVFGPAPSGPTHILPLASFPRQLPNLSLPMYGPCGQILWEQVEGSTYSVEFVAGRSCWLLLKETFHPGWQVLLDDRKVETAMLAPSFVGVAVEPGRHRAVFRYEPWPLRGIVGIAAPVMLLLMAVAEWQGRRLYDLAGRLQIRRRERRTPRWPVWERWEETLRLRWHKEWKWLSVLLLFVFLAGLPTLQMKQMTGHDALEYLPRAVEFYRGLQEGEILPRWAPDLSRGYGQPFFLFNPPLVYYLTSAFHALGTSFVASLNLTCLLLLALAGLGMYLFAREVFGEEGGVVAGVGYVLAPYTLTCLYVRYALADFTAMSLLPWAFWGLRRWAWGREGGPTSMRETGGHLLVAGGATALLPLSSNPVALVVIPVLVMYVLFLARRKRRWRVLGRGLLALVLGLALSAFFWLPAIIERHWVKLDNLLSGYLNYQNHFVYLHQLIYSPWGFGLSLPGPYDEMSFGLGLIPLVMLGVSLVLARYLRAQLRETGEGWSHYGFFLGVLGLAVFLVTDNSLWLWNRLPLLQYLEFPWRALVLAALSTASICAFPFLAVREERRRRWLLLVLLGGFFLAALPYAHPEGFHEVSDADYAPEVIASRGIEVTTTGEYEPIWALARPESPAPASRLFVLAGRVRILEQSITGTSCRWLLEADGPAWLRAAVLYYPGWKLTVDGRIQSPSVQNPYGLMDFGLSAGIHRVELVFRQTALRQWATGISAAALLVTVGWMAWRTWRRHVVGAD